MLGRFYLTGLVDLHQGKSNGEAACIVRLIKEYRTYPTVLDGISAGFYSDEKINLILAYHAAAGCSDTTLVDYFAILLSEIETDSDDETECHCRHHTPRSTVESDRASDDDDEETKSKIEEVYTGDTVDGRMVVPNTILSNACRVNNYSLIRRAIFSGASAYYHSLSLAYQYGNIGILDYFYQQAQEDWFHPDKHNDEEERDYLPKELQVNFYTSLLSAAVDVKNFKLIGLLKKRRDIRWDVLVDIAIKNRSSRFEEYCLKRLARSNKIEIILDDEDEAVVLNDEEISYQRAVRNMIVSAKHGNKKALAKYFTDDHPAANEMACVFAAIYGHLSVVRYFYSRGVGLGADFILIVNSAREGKLNIVKFICENKLGMVVGQRIIDRSLICAAEFGHLPVVRYLCQKYSDKLNHSLLQEAAKEACGNGQELVLLYLLPMLSKVEQKRWATILAQAARLGGFYYLHQYFVNKQNAIITIDQEVI
jgi:hypothetical protein